MTRPAIAPIGPEWMPLWLVHHFLEAQARARPGKTALVCGDRRLSYAALDGQANRLARALRAAGVARGDRVAIYLENMPEAAVAVFGVLKAGAIFSVLNPTTKADKLAFILDDEQPAALITSSDRPRQRVLDEALAAAPVPLVIWVGGVSAGAAADDVRYADWETLLAATPAAPLTTATIDLDLATIIYTSGSTGRPKGVMSTHRNMVFAATSISTYLANTADDVIFCALPLAFDYGLYQLIMAVRVGATLVLERNFAYPYRALDIMRRDRVTGFPGVPTLFALLLDLHDLGRYELPALRYLTNTAAALPVSHIRAIQAAFPRATLFSMYGLTECKRVSYLPPDELARRPESVGLPIPGTEVSIVDEQGQPVPAGVVGELVVRGSHVMAGYWRRPEATARRFRPGAVPGETVLYTGDLFRRDAEGYLYFVGRQDDIIKCRGEKVSPKEIENALAAMPGVREAAAVGVPDARLGEAIAVFVAPRAGATLSEHAIRAYCASHLEDFMVPRYIELRPALPKGGTGKIDKQELRACAASLVV